MCKRVVITGIGLVSPIGSSKDIYFESLCKGIKLDGPVYPINDFKASDYINANSARKMTKSAQYGVAAAKMSLEDANLEIDESNSRSIGVVAASTFGSGGGMDKYLTNIEKYGGSKASPIAFVNIMHQATTAQICINNRIQGFHVTLVTPGSGLLAIERGADMIKAGRANIVLSGGSEEISPIIMDLGKAGSFFCTDDDFEKSIPLHNKSTGSCYGQGSCFVVLEEMEHAINRGAHIYGEISGYGDSAEALGTLWVDPEGNGLGRAFERAFNMGNVCSKNIDCIFASANGYRPSDRGEVKAISRLDIKEDIPITAVKSTIGECFGASGAFQVAAALQSMNKSVIPPIAGMSNAEALDDNRFVSGSSLKMNLENALISSIYPGGENSALIIRKWYI